MSDFLRLVNGQYGMYYRTLEGGKGYSFQSRYKSTLIENDAYLLQSILYLLRNPVRAGIVHAADNYNWSSAQLYYSSPKSKIADTEFVNELFGCKEEFLSALHAMINREPNVLITKYGEVMGSESFPGSALKKHNRRKRSTRQSLGVQRKDEHNFDPVEKVLWEFERITGVSYGAIDTKTAAGKRLRAKHLVYLKERAGLKYKEIGEFDIFGDLKFTSLRSIYGIKRKKKIT
ncbi:MAG: hypothetical protein GY765_33395, partial [bacterium]|nr:hypothetical protein [bacterium]